MSRQLCAGKRVHKWTKEETSHLITSIKSQLKFADPLPYSRRIALLNWDKVSVPFRTSEECRIHLDVIIKKIRRTRSLEEILSALDMDPIDKNKKERSSPIRLSILKDIKNEMKGRDSVSRDRNNNAASNAIIVKRKSQRLSEANKRHSSNESTRIRSHLTPFMIFAKCNSTKETNTEDVLKEQYDMLTDIEKLFWIRKSVISSSSDDAFESFLTEEEYVLLSEDLNNVSRTRKRKLKASDDTAGFKCKKIKIIEETPIEIDGSVDQEMTEPQQFEFLQDIIALDEKVECLNDIEQLGNDSASEIEMKDISMKNTYEVLLDGDAAIEPEMESKEELKIETNDGMAKTEESIKEIKQEKYESPPIIYRIKNFCSGFLGRIGSWVAKD